MNENKINGKLWGGRFEKTNNELMEDFNSSISFDSKLYKYDIQGSIAHTKMLSKTGILTENELEKIESALYEIEKEIESGKVEFSRKHEDIHMNIEVLLTEKIGQLGKKIHTARSRNDQVALDLKLYSRDSVDKIILLLKEWIETLVNLAEENIDTVMPGYTHLQRAQPISYAHNLNAHSCMALKDIKKLKAWKSIHDTMPLGSGALAGTTFDIDRFYTSSVLGFETPSINSLDGVSDRDFVIDLLYIASTSMMHLSRICEEIILFSSQEFSFISLDDEYSTGSSMMPQKKNPDAAELIRGKTGRVYGDLISILTTMKALPLAYNKDMQEDKECLFDGVETWMKCLKIISPMMKTAKINKENMMNAAKGGFTNATDLADYLVKKGIPFRDAHKITGEIVFECINRKISLEEMEIDEYKKYSSIIEDDVYDYIDIKNCVDSRNSFGATGSVQVRKTIEILRKELEEI